MWTAVINRISLNRLRTQFHITISAGKNGGDNEFSSLQLKIRERKIELAANSKWCVDRRDEYPMRAIRILFLAFF